VLGGTIWLTLGTFGAQAFAALLYIVVARDIGPHAFGTVMAAVGIALVGSDIVDFGMNLWVLATGTRADPDEITAQYQRKVSAAALISVVAVPVVAAAQAGFGSGPDALCLVPLILVGHVAVASGTAIAVRTGQARAASMLTFLERFVAAGAGLGLFAVGVDGLSALVIGLITGEAASMAYQTARLEAGRKLLSFRLRGLGGQLRRGFPFAASNLASDIIQLHVVIVGAVAGAAAAGDYAAATRLMAVFVIATGALSTILPGPARPGCCGGRAVPPLALAARRDGRHRRCAGRPARALGRPAGLRRGVRGRRGHRPDLLRGCAPGQRRTAAVGRPAGVRATGSGRPGGGRRPGSECASGRGRRVALGCCGWSGRGGARPRPRRGPVRARLAQTDPPDERCNIGCQRT
jgi:hypothetical protein